jgi:hypothetical protein
MVKKTEVTQKWSFHSAPENLVVTIENDLEVSKKVNIKQQQIMLFL